MFQNILRALPKAKNEITASRNGCPSYSMAERQISGVQPPSATTSLLASIPQRQLTAAERLAGSSHAHARTARQRRRSLPRLHDEPPVSWAPRLTRPIAQEYPRRCLRRSRTPWHDYPRSRTSPAESAGLSGRAEPLYSYPLPTPSCPLPAA